ncbi:MAG: S24 family peptidase [Candidatus Thermoplasmatota archaeon]|nr:S24 family peptidase [Candidatus Thermoplasmatota archaeon]
MTEALDVRIQGDSMWPSYLDGDVVSFARCDQTYVARVNDVVLVRHPMKDNVLMVKRVSVVQNDGRLFLTGDNPDPTASEDSHNFGPVWPAMVRAFVRPR